MTTELAEYIGGLFIFSEPVETGTRFPLETPPDPQSPYRQLDLKVVSPDKVQIWVSGLQSWSKDDRILHVFGKNRINTQNLELKVGRIARFFGFRRRIIWTSSLNTK